MELFGGKKVDRTQDPQRIKEIQELIRTFAGDVDETKVEMAQIREMMRVKKVEPEQGVKTTVETGVAVDVQKVNFCTRCGSRLPEDGSGCARCRSSKENAPSTRPVQEAKVPVGPIGQTKTDRMNFCTRCGSRLPEDGSGCASCARADLRRCPNCGAMIRASDNVCPICHRATLFKGR
jgi:membrane protease subunit (stomatin/prohibitin family)